MHTHIHEGKISYSFFSARKKNCHRHVNGFGDLNLYFLFAIDREAWRNIFNSISNLGKKQRHSLKWKFARALVARAQLYRVLNKWLKKTNWNRFFRLADEFVHSFDDSSFPLKCFKVFPSFGAISYDCISHPYVLYISFYTWFYDWSLIFGIEAAEVNQDKNNKLL